MTAYPNDVTQAKAVEASRETRSLSNDKRRLVEHPVRAV